MERALAKGQMTKPPLSTVIDPEDHQFIVELKQRGETNSRVAEILHVTEDALHGVLDTLNM